MAGAGRPRVAALEWLDPVFIGGHWVPQMIELAGGEDVLGLPGEKSRTATWEEVEAAAPEVVVSMPCGYATARAARETARGRASSSGPLGARVVAVDASAYFSRPGPRLVDGIELLGHLLHPDLVPEPPPGRAQWLTRPARRGLIASWERSEPSGRSSSRARRRSASTPCWTSRATPTGRTP